MKKSVRTPINIGRKRVSVRIQRISAFKRDAFLHAKSVMDFIGSHPEYQDRVNNLYHELDYLCKQYRKGRLTRNQAQQIFGMTDFLKEELES